MTLLYGLYAITDPALCPDDRILEQVQQALDGGVRLLQYRNKTASANHCQQQATAILALCQQANVPLLINDDVALAKQIGADGVHIGQTDGAVANACTSLGEHAIIGVTCHDSIELALHAQQQGASYVAFGRFFTSKTKPDASPADASILTAAKQQLTIPVCAIGGITAENGTSLLTAGADMLAVINGVFAATNVETAARQYAQLFADNK